MLQLNPFFLSNHHNQSHACQLLRTVDVFLAISSGILLESIRPAKERKLDPDSWYYNFQPFAELFVKVKSSCK